MRPINILLTVLSTLLGVPSVYMCITGLFTLKPRAPYPSTKPKTRFAVIIPARNEQKVIANILKALKNQSYPKKLMDVYVAINHCTDDTETIALKNGAKIIRCSDAVRRKGDVLHEVFEALPADAYDAYAIFDADNMPHEHFLQAVNDAMQGGERICKGRLKTGNPFDSWVSGGYALYHVICELFYSRPHTTLGFSSNLVGTGFAVHRDVIEALGGWNTGTICEDTELLAQAALIGYRVAFIPEAISYDEQVRDFAPSLTQRLRWSRGMVQCAVRYTRRLFSSKCPNRPLARDLAMLFIISLLSPLSMPLMLVNFLLQPHLVQLVLCLALPLMYVGVAVFACIMLRLGGYNVSKMLPAACLFPLFLLSWMVLQLIALFVPVKVWKPIAHNGQTELG